ncbi:MAG: glycosyltransferase family 2 protein [Clostridiales bacterium]|nr:glycosyltransferase family 2 protein [Clostridiales bacterium]
MKKISVVIPCYNEEDVIEVTYQRMNSVMKDMTEYEYELIFVNDGSKDKTLEKLMNICKSDSNSKIINFARNFGHQIAITAGLDFATGDYIAFIDADLQDPPELIKEMVTKLEEGYNVAYGKRKKRKGETIFKKATAKAFYRVLRNLSDVDIPVDTGDFRVIDRKVADVLRNLKEKDRFIRGLVSWSGFKQIAVEFDRDERKAGETKYTLKKMVKLSLDGILSFSSKPLLFSVEFGIISCFISFVFLILGLIFKFMLVPDILIIFTILLMGGLNLMCLGIIGEYIGRIYNEAKARPLYTIDELINFKDND